MKKALVTGGLGAIGSIITDSLAKEFEFTILDTKQTGLKQVNGCRVFPVDITSSPAALHYHAEGKDVIIHLGWYNEENHRSDKVVLANKQMMGNIFRVACQERVKRVVVPSSIHAASWQRWQGPGLMQADMQGVAANQYGVTKLYFEDWGRYFAFYHGLEVICVRFGGVNVEDECRQEKDYAKIWLSRRDCASLIRRCIEAPEVPGNFCVFYGVSNNTGRAHDWANPLGWKPQSDSAFAFGPAGRK